MVMHWRRRRIRLNIATSAFREVRYIALIKSLNSCQLAYIHSRRNIDGMNMISCKTTRTVILPKAFLRVYVTVTTGLLLNGGLPFSLASSCENLFCTRLPSCGGVPFHAHPALSNYFCFVEEISEMVRQSTAWCPANKNDGVNDGVIDGVIESVFAKAIFITLQTAIKRDHWLHCTYSWIPFSYEISLPP